jgi:hypothetical protein
MKNVFNDCKVTVLQSVVADDTLVTFRGVDMAADGGYDGVAFAFGVQDGSVVDTYVAHVQQDGDSAYGSASNLLGSALTFSSITGAKTVVLDIGKPGERYVRPILLVPNGAATTVVSCTAIQYNARSAPATQDSTTSGSWTGEYHAAPAAGTA